MTSGSSYKERAWSIKGNKLQMARRQSEMEKAARDEV